jgi:cystathionine beta-synthase
MRENGFLIPDRVTLRYVLQSKAKGVQQLIAIGSASPARKALELIRENDISQLPVIDNGRPVGTVIDSDLLTAVLEDSTKLDLPVSKIMKPAFPVLGAASPVEHAIDYLKGAAVLVEDEHTIVGILTRYDVIEYMTR